MKLGPIALKIRVANTRFGNRIGGAAEFDVARNNTLSQEVAFVIPAANFAQANEHSTYVTQKINENFAVIVAIRNDIDRTDKLGIKAYDDVEDVRAEIWRAILGWEIPDNPTVDGPISFVGGSLLDINRGWLWYQFEFAYPIHVDTINDGIGDNSGDLPVFEELYAQYKLAPSDDLPIAGAEGLPTTESVDMTQIVTKDS